MLLMLATAASAQTAGTRLIWDRDTAPTGAHAPTLIPFRDGQALQFSSAKETWLDLGHGDGECLQITGTLSLTAVVQLTSVPTKKVPFVSKWHCCEGGRSYELGVMPNRTVFFAISGSGVYDAKAREFYTDEKLAVGVPYVVSGVFTPGRRMAVYINGASCGSLGHRVPRSIFRSQTPVLVGTRPGAERSLGLDGLIGEVRIEPRALAAAETAAISEKTVTS